MENKKNLRFFVVMTNIVFWLFLGICGLVIVLGVPMDTISKYAPVLGSWASFFVLMVWAKKKQLQPPSNMEQNMVSHVRRLNIN